MKALAFAILGCTIAAQEPGWELLRCENGMEICYVSHDLFPPEERRTLSCFYEPVRNKLVIPPAPNDLQFHGR